MATWDDVRRIMTSLPEVDQQSSRGLVQWRVKKKLVAWERPLRKADLEALGEEPSDDPVLGVRVPDVGAREALVADDPDVFFTTPHFDGYPAILVRLDRIPEDELREVLVEGWLEQAPKRLAREYLASMEQPGAG
jgi:hypothetical protein